MRITVWVNGRYIVYKTVKYTELRKYKFTKRYPYPEFRYILIDYKLNEHILHNSEYIFKCLKKLER